MRITSAMPKKVSLIFFCIGLYVTENVIVYFPISSPDSIRRICLHFGRKEISECVFPISFIMKMDLKKTGYIFYKKRENFFCYQEIYFLGMSLSLESEWHLCRHLVTEDPHFHPFCTPYFIIIVSSTRPSSRRPHTEVSLTFLFRLFYPHPEKKTLFDLFFLQKLTATCTESVLLLLFISRDCPFKSILFTMGNNRDYLYYLSILVYYFLLCQKNIRY